MTATTTIQPTTHAASVPAAFSAGVGLLLVLIIATLAPAAHAAGVAIPPVSRTVSGVAGTSPRKAITGSFGPRFDNAAIRNRIRNSKTKPGDSSGYYYSRSTHRWLPTAGQKEINARNAKKERESERERERDRERRRNKNSK